MQKNIFCCYGGGYDQVQILMTFLSNFWFKLMTKLLPSDLYWNQDNVYSHTDVLRNSFVTNTQLVLLCDEIFISIFSQTDNLWSKIRWDFLRNSRFDKSSKWCLFIALVSKLSQPFLNQTAFFSVFFTFVVVIICNINSAFLLCCYHGC